MESFVGRCNIPDYTSEFLKRFYTIPNLNDNKHFSECLLRQLERFIRMVSFANFEYVFYKLEETEIVHSDGMGNLLGNTTNLPGSPSFSIAEDVM